MGYDRDPFDFEPNGILFGSKNRNENCHHDHIPFNMKGNGNKVFSVWRRGTTSVIKGTLGLALCWES